MVNRLISIFFLIFIGLTSAVFFCRCPVDMDRNRLV